MSASLVDRLDLPHSRCLHLFWLLFLKTERGQRAHEENRDLLCFCFVRLSNQRIQFIKGREGKKSNAFFTFSPHQICFFGAIISLSAALFGFWQRDRYGERAGGLKDIELLKGLPAVHHCHLTHVESEVASQQPLGGHLLPHTHSDTRHFHTQRRNHLFGCCSADTHARTHARTGSIFTQTPRDWNTRVGSHVLFLFNVITDGNMTANKLSKISNSSSSEITPARARQSRLCTQLRGVWLIHGVPHRVTPDISALTEETPSLFKRPRLQAAAGPTNSGQSFIGQKLVCCDVSARRCSLKVRNSWSRKHEEHLKRTSAPQMAFSSVCVWRWSSFLSSPSLRRRYPQSYVTLFPFFLLLSVFLSNIME